jgi:TonB family protein
MHRIRFIHPPPADHEVRRRAMIASFVLHGSGLTVLLLITLYYATHLTIVSTSTAGAPTMILEPTVVMSTPSEPPPPSEQMPTVPMPQLPTEQVSSPLTPMKMPEIGVPVLPPVPASAPLVKTKPSHEKAHGTTTASAKPSAPKNATTATSGNPGTNVMPHPPYPEEALDHGQTGTVVVLVEFDAKGDVVSAKISESSGVPELDLFTCSFIRAHWHSAEHAGESIPQPVEYQISDH